MQDSDITVAESIAPAAPKVLQDIFEHWRGLLDMGGDLEQLVPSLLTTLAKKNFPEFISPRLEDKTVAESVSQDGAVRNALQEAIQSGQLGPLLRLGMISSTANLNCSEIPDVLCRSYPEWSQ